MEVNNLFDNYFPIPNDSNRERCKYYLLDDLLNYEKVNDPLILNKAESFLNKFLDVLPENYQMYIYKVYTVLDRYDTGEISIARLSVFMRFDPEDYETEHEIIINCDDTLYVWTPKEDKMYKDWNLWFKNFDSIVKLKEWKV